MGTRWSRTLFLIVCWFVIAACSGNSCSSCAPGITPIAGGFPLGPTDRRIPRSIQLRLTDQGLRKIEQVAPAASPDVDAYLTPAALAALTRGEGRYASQRTGGLTPSPDTTTRGGPMPRPVYWGMNRARMSVADEGGSETVFTFERKGPFEWKLVHVGLPDGTAAATRVVPPVPRVGKSGKTGG